MQNKWHKMRTDSAKRREWSITRQADRRQIGEDCKQLKKYEIPYCITPCTTRLIKKLTFKCVGVPEAHPSILMSYCSVYHLWYLAGCLLLLWMLWWPARPWSAAHCRAVRGNSRTPRCPLRKNSTYSLFYAVNFPVYFSKY